MTILDFIFPKLCVSCGRLGEYICKRCQKQIIPIAPNGCICPVCEKPAIGGATHPKCRGRYTLDGLTSFFYYKDVVRQVITSIKYAFVQDMASLIVEKIPISAYEIYALRNDPHALLVPVPLHASRYKFRGFNQSELMGKIIASRLGIVVQPDLLERVTPTTPQVQMKKKEDRLSNIKKAFAVRRIPKDISNMNVLLFDDVFTTGATLRDAANTLKRHGAKNVWGVTIAR